MKHLCSSRFLSLLFLFFSSALFGSLHDKSALIYLGEKISYPMVGIHDYIIVDPQKTNLYTHGFELYKDKIYAKLSVTPKSDAKTLLNKILNLHKKGFLNFFIDAKDGSTKQTVFLLNTLSSKNEFENTHILLHPTDKLSFSDIVNTFDGIVLYNAQKIPNLSQKIRKLKHFSDTIIDIETTTNNQSPKKRIVALQKIGVIGYITNPTQDIYGYGVKNAVKREILTIIDESKWDRTVVSAHQVGAMPLEYLGYIQTLYDIRDGLPDPDNMTQYAGVVVWLNTEYKFPEKIVEWVNKLYKKGIYVAFASSFGFNIDEMFLEQLGIEVSDGEEGVSKRVIVKDPIMDFEIKARPSEDTLYFTPPANSKPLFSYQDSNGEISTPAAITPWGGYAISDSFMVEIDKENIWVINPFEYFKQALRLKPLVVPDPTTENGSRLAFSHVDGDGYISQAEFNPQKLSGEIIYKEILKKYKFPHSISIIGAEVMPNGLFPNLSKRCLDGIRKIYALDNVEAATHTFTHTFFWGKIDKNGDLKPEYRLKPKGYKYSLEYEIKGMIDFINDNLLDKKSKKRAKAVFWSGDCAPRTNALSLVYKNHILNINGGDTTISNAKPWLALVAPYGLARDEYYQIYTGQQNENVFTNDWLGPFWGFKRVVQTFKLTDKPRRLKPIDIYYHLYSGSKKASLNALRYVFDWVLKQPDIMPIFTSSYIPKVMDYYSASLANEGDEWLICGMRDLKNLRLETKKQHIEYKSSPTVLGEKIINNRTYIALSPKQSHLLKLTKKQEDSNYLISSNAKVDKIIKGNRSTRYIFQAEVVGVKLKYHLANECTLHTTPKAQITYKADGVTLIEFGKKIHKGIVDVRCR